MIHIRRVEGHSMMPSLKPGQIVLVSNARSFGEGDVVIIFYEGREWLKRVHRHKDGKVYVKGDNESDSTDSRVFGWIVDRHVIGRVIFPKV